MALSNPFPLNLVIWLIILAISRKRANSIIYAPTADLSSTPNKLSSQALTNLKSRSGVWPTIRAGGSTANRPTYNASLDVGARLIYSTPGSDQPSGLVLGPRWYESFQTAPKGTQYIYGVNYRDNSSVGINNTLAEAARVWHALGDSLYAYELGNEMEGFANKGRASNWNISVYVEDYLNYTNLIDKYVFGSKAKEEPRFQAGTFQGSGGPWITPNWNSVAMLQRNITRYGQIKSTSQHDVRSQPLISHLLIFTNDDSTWAPTAHHGTKLLSWAKIS